MSILNELAKGYKQLKDEEEQTKEAEQKAGKENTGQEGQEEDEEPSLREQVELLSQAVLELHEKVNADQEKEEEEEKGGAE